MADAADWLDEALTVIKALQFDKPRFCFAHLHFRSDLQPKSIMKITPSLYLNPFEVDEFQVLLEESLEQPAWEVYNFDDVELAMYVRCTLWPEFFGELSDWRRRDAVTLLDEVRDCVIRHIARLRRKQMTRKATRDLENQTKGVLGLVTSFPNLIEISRWKEDLQRRLC